MKMIQQLEFKQKLDSKIKKGHSFDRIFLETAFLSDFGDFLDTKIGKVWLAGKNGEKYQSWQER